MFPRISVLFLLLLAPACGASASISAARDPGVSARFDRIYAVLDQGTADPEYTQALRAALEHELHRRGVTCNVRIVMGLDFEAKAAQREAETWRPDALLIANFNGGSGPFNTLEDVTYDVSLIDASSNRRIWRAQVSSRRGLGSTAGMMGETASRVVERLEQDRLIGGR